MPINSRSKGKVGELEAAAFLRSFGFEARRGQQFSGVEGEDVVHSIPNIHLEVKRVEAGNPYTWLAQATRDAGAKIPVVMHRKNRQDWIVVLRAEDFVKMAKELEDLKHDNARMYKEICEHVNTVVG